MHPAVRAIVRSPLLLAIVVTGAGWVSPMPAQAADGDQVNGLSLVYLDASKPGAAEVWIRSLDGTAKRMVAAYATLP